MKPAVSVIVAFYNNLKFLRLVLAGFERQTFKAFELVIADDGSREEVVNEINILRSSYAFPIAHVWHQDDGWKKNIILNQAIAKSTGEFLIFIDADCIPHKAFISDHYLSRQKNVFLAGRRVHLSPRINNKLTERGVKGGMLEAPFQYFLDSLLPKPRTRNSEKAIYIKNRYLKKFLNRKPTKLLGCNMSMYKADLLRLNGFDERYLHAGTGEDVDLNLRAENSNFQIKSIKNQAIQYHLWHPRSNHTKNSDNLKLLKENDENKVTATHYSCFAKDI